MRFDAESEILHSAAYYVPMEYGQIDADVHLYRMISGRAIFKFPDCSLSDRLVMTITILLKHNNKGLHFLRTRFVRCPSFCRKVYVKIYPFSDSPSTSFHSGCANTGGVV